MWYDNVIFASLPSANKGKITWRRVEHSGQQYFFFPICMLEKKYFFFVSSVSCSLHSHPTIPIQLCHLFIFTQPSSQCHNSYSEQLLQYQLTQIMQKNLNSTIIIWRSVSTFLSCLFRILKIVHYNKDICTSGAPTTLSAFSKCRKCPLENKVVWKGRWVEEFSS